jgi:RND superfamily putative drug exporter
VVAAGLPLGVGILSIVGGVAGVFALAHVTDASQYAINIVTLVGLGVSIDYSLFIVNRFREELAAGGSRAQAISTTMTTAGRPSPSPG